MFGPRNRAVWAQDNLGMLIAPETAAKTGVLRGRDREGEQLQGRRARREGVPSSLSVLRETFLGGTC